MVRRRFPKSIKNNIRNFHIGAALFAPSSCCKKNRIPLSCGNSFAKARKKMTPKDVVAFFGGTQVKAARAIGVRQSTVSEWVQIGYVPLGRQYELQVLTGGQLKADPDAVRRTKTSAGEPA